MIIKSMSRKTPSFEQLTAYMLAPQDAQVELVHNLPATAYAPNGIVQEFTENHDLLPGRVNGNALYHEILALEPNADIPKKAQIVALRKLAQRYLERRAPEQLAIGVIHAETAHVHMHLMISSNAILSKKREWLAKKDFAEIQREMEDYRIQHFPELGTTRLFDRHPDQRKSSIRETAAKLRTGKASHKEELTAALKAILQGVKSREALDAELAKHDLTLYRRGRSVGVMTNGGRRYRFSTLGLTERYTEAMARIELLESRMASLQRGRGSDEREVERSR